MTGEKIGLNSFIGQLIFTGHTFEDFLVVFLILLGWLETGDVFKYLYNLNINIISPAIKLRMQHNVYL